MESLMLVLVTTLGALGEELTARASIRFPSEDFSQVHSGVEIYTAESQASPLVLQPSASNPHFILPQVPASTHLFGKPNSKGYSQGYILQQHSLPVRQESEFHHTLPPPMKATTYGAPRPIIQSSRPKPSSPYNRHPERHRFAPQRYPQHQMTKGKPEYHGPVKTLFAPKPQIKDNKSQLSDAIHKYSILTQHDSPVKHNKNKDHDYVDVLTQPSFNGQRDHEIPIIKGSSDFPYKGNTYDHDEYIPHSNIKYFGNPSKFPKDSYEDFREGQNIKYYNKEKKYFPQSEESRYPSYSKEPSYPSKVTKFHDYQEHFGNQGEKPYIPTKDHSHDYVPDLSIKGVHDDFSEDQKSKFVHSKYKKQVSDSHNPQFETEQASLGNFYENRFGQNVGYNPSKPFSYRQYEESPLDKAGSEWTPINAPEGAVPAKSYDIPAPDLSRGFYSGSPFFSGRVEDERIQRIPEHSLGHSFHKRGNSEEVVSAVVMVKQ